MKLNLLVIGQTGQLARALARQIQLSNDNAVFLDRAECDLSGPSTSILDALVAHEKPDALIIAAAYTNVDGAETDRETAFAVNSEASSVIAKYCKELDIPLIHISTDYVFDGNNKQPYLPGQKTKPIGVYGASKLAGEQGILASGCRAVILRTSWVFDGTGKNFLTTMLRIAASTDTLKVVDDQIGRPTYAGHLAQAVLAATRLLVNKSPGSTGVFHVSGSGDPVSWAGFAAEIFAQSAEVSKPISITGIPSSDFPTPAARPKYSVMDISAFEDAFGYALPHWKEGLREALAERELRTR